MPIADIPVNILAELRKRLGRGMRMVEDFTKRVTKTVHGLRVRVERPIKPKVAEPAKPKVAVPARRRRAPARKAA